MNEFYASPALAKKFGITEARADEILNKWVATFTLSDIVWELGKVDALVADALNVPVKFIEDFMIEFEKVVNV